MDRSCAPLASMRLELAEVTTIPLEAHEVPADIVIIESEIGVLLADRATLLRFDHRGEGLPPVVAGDSITAVAAGSTQSYWMGTGSSVHRWIPDDGGGTANVHLILPLDSLPGKVASLAETARHLWFVVQRGDRFELSVMETHEVLDGRARALGTVDLPGPARVRAVPGKEEIVIGLSAFPFSVIRTGPDLALRTVFSESGSSAGAHPLDASHYHALPALPIACDSILQTIVDLRSAARRLRLLDGQAGGLVREREVHAPFGVTDRSQTLPWLVGARERRGGRDIVIMQWFLKDGAS